ncbi:MAG: hypothetical protein KIS67_13595 [Verrucomicrobiae bacterium]|nr:hypothetical protein [Verrucomicrobiae bacterium]
MRGSDLESGPLELEWNFDAVPGAELVACCYWEYARESAFIRDVRRQGLQNWRAGGKWDLALSTDIQKLQSIGYRAEVFLRGFFFEPDIIHQSTDANAPHYRHPDAPPITGSFPKPWQALCPEERAYRAGCCRKNSASEPTPFRLAHWGWAKDLAQHVESQARRMRAELPPDQGLGPIRPALCFSNAETLLVDIDWAQFTNDQIAQAFRRHLKAIRPPHLPEPDGRGHKPGDWRAQLTRLAVMRLLSRFTTLELVAKNAFPAIWQTKQFAGRKWGDITKWHDARRDARRLFHRLFPFLPATEKPLSWVRRRPGQ